MLWITKCSSHVYPGLQQYITCMPAYRLRVNYNPGLFSNDKQEIQFLTMFHSFEEIQHTLLKRMSIFRS